MSCIRSRPQLALTILAIAGGLMGFLSQAPNRLLSGHPVALWNAAPAWALCMLALCLACLLASALLPESRGRDNAALAIACCAIVLLPATAGQGSEALALHSPHATRFMLGAGFWVMFFALALLATDSLRRLDASAFLRCAAVLAIVAAVLAMARGGTFDALSLAQEFGTHRAAFATALQRHLLLVAATLAIAIAAGLPLGVAVQRRRRLRGPVFATLNVVQTIPSVALFGLLIAPLSAAGLSGIGTAPALIALVLYALLPVVRNTVAGLDQADPATLEAAIGIGMAPGQILLRVALPLAAPALLAGLRIVTVQTIGLAVVAALIGAGGLGDFVFQGLGQYAVDLVLLGALPAIALALAADFILQLAATPFRTRLS